MEHNRAQQRYLVTARQCWSVRSFFAEKMNMPAPQTRLGGVFTEKGNLVRLPKGRLLQSRGELSERLYYLVNVHVVLHLSSLVGKELTLDVFGPGELIG